VKGRNISDSMRSVGVILHPSAFILRLCAADFIASAETQPPSAQSIFETPARVLMQTVLRVLSTPSKVTQDRQKVAHRVSLEVSHLLPQLISLNALVAQDIFDKVTCRVLRVRMDITVLLKMRSSARDVQSIRSRILLCIRGTL
jgi:hypothetical protein